MEFRFKKPKIFLVFLIALFLLKSGILVGQSTNNLNQGNLDLNFNLSQFTGNLPNGFGLVNDIIPIPSTGKFVVIGSFSHHNGISSPGIVMLTKDGNIDLSFNYEPRGFNGVALKGVFTNNRLIIIGDFSFYGIEERNRIIALNLNGSIDNSFNVGTGFNGSAASIVVQSDLKIVIGGTFTSYNGTSANKLVRLNPNGTIDPTLNIGTGPNLGFIRGLAIDGDGRIYCGGDFTSFNGTSKRRLARLSSTGALDATFNNGTGFTSGVWDIKLNSASKILVCGDFTSYNGITRQRVVLLNSDGTIDATFGTTANANDIVYTALVEPITDKFIIAGAFFSIGGAYHYRIVRLNSNGTVDPTFEKGAAFNDGVVRILKYSESGQILAGGNFSYYHSYPTGRLVQINGCTKSANPVIYGPSVVCSGSTITLTSSYPTDNLWSTGATTQSITVNSAGSFFVQSNSSGCITNKSDLFTVTTSPLPSAPTITGNTLLCPSSTLSLSGPSGVAGYIWSNGTTSQYNTINTTGTYTLRIINASGCTSAVSPNYVITNAPSGGWLGNNTNWNDPTNWCGGVPISTTDVQLPTTTNNFPVISGTTEVCRNLEIPSGKTLTINSAARLNLYGNITGSGNIIGPFNSELRVLGSTSQTLRNLSVGILRINNTAGASLSSNVVISKDLDLVNGVLTTNSYSALLLSTAETLTETANAYVNGKVRVSSKFVGTGTLNLMGVSIASGADNLDTVLIERRNEIPTFGTNQGIGYVWSIRAGNAPTAGRNVTFSWRDGITNGRNLSSMQVYRRQESSSDWVKVGAVQNASSRSITVNTTSFSDWTVSDTEQPLPVTLIRFTGERIEYGNQLNWTTSSEINNQGFQVERSIDGKIFTKIGFVKGNGTTNTKQTYQFIDVNSSEVYYRLQQVDIDGKTVYSATIKVGESSVVNTLEVYPNPATDQITIQTYGEGTLEIVNMVGKVVINQPAKTTNEINISKLAKGIYTVKLNGTSQKLVLK